MYKIRKTERNYLMGRTVGIEPTHVGTTIQCVNHFTMFAITLKIIIDKNVKSNNNIIKSMFLKIYN